MIAALLRNINYTLNDYKNINDINLIETILKITYENENFIYKLHYYIVTK